MSHWEVQTQFIYGWENVWTVYEDNLSGRVVDKLQTFNTEAEAQLELDEHLEMEANAFANGDVGYAPELSDYRIVFIEKEIA